MAENSSFVPPVVSCKVPRISLRAFLFPRPPTKSAQACFPSPPHETCNPKEPVSRTNSGRCAEVKLALLGKNPHIPRFRHHQGYLPWSSQCPSHTKFAPSCLSGRGRPAVLGGGVEMSETHAGMRQSLRQVMETGNSRVWVPGRQWNLVSQLSQS